MTGYIYCITNKINGKQYVGQTRYSLHERFLNHCTSAKRPDRENRPLYRAMRKYGCENFDIQLLEEVPVEDLDKRECYWIQKLNTYHLGYNATVGGDGKQKYTIDDYNNIVQLYQQGYNVNQVAHLCQCSADTASKVLSANNCNAYENAHRQSCHPILQYDCDMRFIQKHQSCADAAILLQQQGVKATITSIITNIGRVARGVRQSCYGFKWRYPDNT